ncbi:MAG: hypothetical protein J6Q17_05635, partial [Clostridia bacterium]|nr:hypothetical protein [Clostridia bacterium]
MPWPSASRRIQSVTSSMGSPKNCSPPWFSSGISARMMAERAGGRVPEAGQVEEILRLAGETAPHTVPLPGGIECTLADGFVRFGTPEKDPEPPPVFLWPRDGSRYENPLCVLQITSGAEID